MTAIVSAMTVLNCQGKSWKAANTVSVVPAISARKTTGTANASAVSQTAGPETVLCGELELPFGLIGFVTDYANEVAPGEPTPVDELIELMGRSTSIFGDVLRIALPLIEATSPTAAGTVYRFEQA